jgi:hypothetical protein
MSERPYKVEQWSRDFDGVTKVILEARAFPGCDESIVIGLGILRGFRL